MDEVWLLEIISNMILETILFLNGIIDEMNSDDSLYSRIAAEAWDFGVGLTPILPIRVKEHVTIYAKLEGFNRFKSIKDRAAFFMIGMALKKGVLDKSKTLIEASSGNTGIAIASIATAMGYRAEIYVPEASSAETRNVLKATGAEIIEVSDENSKKGKINIDRAVSLVHEKLENEPEKYVNLDQYSNVSNTNAHVYTTGPEIISALSQIDASPENFVAGVGTGGTITGIATFMKKAGQNCTIYGAEPDQNHHIQGLKNLTASKVPQILSLKMDIIDRWVPIDDKMAYEGTRRITQNGYFAGISSGANFMAALKIASKMDRGNVVTVFPDSAEKYRSVLIERKIFTENEYDRFSDTLFGVPEGAVTLSKKSLLSGA